MDKRIAKRIACSLAADLIWSGTYATLALQSLGYTGQDTASIKNQMDDLIDELRRRGQNAPTDPARPRGNTPTDTQNYRKG